MPQTFNQSDYEDNARERKIMSQAVTTTAKQQVSRPNTVKGWLESPEFRQQLALVASKHITPERFVRVGLTALLKNPKLSTCTPESVLKSCLTSAQMGIETDGRHAHLIPYGNECTFQMDWKGYAVIAERNGYQVTTKVVFSNDKFQVQEDDGTGKTKVVHEVDYTKDRGEIAAFYCRSVDSEGRVDYEIMSRKEVEYVRDSFSRAKDADAWKKSFGEMGRKTVLKRHSKRWNLDVDLEAEEGDTASAVVKTIIVDSPPAMPSFAAALPEPPAIEATAAVMTDEPKPQAQPTVVQEQEAKPKAKKAEKPVEQKPPAELLAAALKDKGLEAEKCLAFYNNPAFGLRGDSPEAKSLSDIPEQAAIAIRKNIVETPNEAVIAAITG